MVRDMITVADIIGRCGGVSAIEERSFESQHAITHWAARKWLVNGIPRDHFELVMRIGGVSADDIIVANKAIKRRSRAAKTVHVAA